MGSIFRSFSDKRPATQSERQALARRTEARAFTHEIKHSPDSLDSRCKHSNVVELIRCASEVFEMPELNCNGNPLYKLLRRLKIQHPGQQYFFSKHDDPKRVEVLTDEYDRRDQIHFEIVSSSVKKTLFNPQTGKPENSETIQVLTVNILS